MSSPFLRYATVGLANTALHWLVFGLCLAAAGLGQGAANLLGFLVAASFSFWANARYTFRAAASPRRYALHLACLGSLAWGLGALAQRAALAPLATLVLFSGASLFLGFLASRFLVFQGARP